MTFLKAVGITGVIAVLFYRSFWAAVLFPIVYFVELKSAQIAEKERKRTILLEEFLHGMGILNSSLQAGLSMENAWREVEREIQLLYGNKSEFFLEVHQMNKRVAHNLPVEKLFLEFAYRCKVEEIIQFAELMEFGKRSGGNWKKIIATTVEKMTECQEAKKKGEEASTKMLVPLLLMLIIVMGIVMLPALIEFKV